MCDQGPGIPVNQQYSVWQAFQRLERDEKRGINGTGIGLSIAAENLKAIGAQCRIINLDNGCCFEIHLPLNKSCHDKNTYH